MLGFALYHAMLPMFFPEFARLGNDSLCLLLAGASAFSLVRALRPDGPQPVVCCLRVLPRPSDC